MSQGQAQMFVGKPTKRYKQGTIVLLTRRPRSKWWKIVCFGQKGHYAKDGSCPHTDELFSHLRPDIASRTRLEGWGAEA